MTKDTMINRARGAEHFFTMIGMFFYAELINAMREELQKREG